MSAEFRIVDHEQQLNEVTFCFEGVGWPGTPCKQSSLAHHGFTRHRATVQANVRLVPRLTGPRDRGQHATSSWSQFQITGLDYMSYLGSKSVLTLPRVS